uniref:Uncharacterized protein n=1 Tax=Anopheles atroparvus TaxID=41427 RepID=A0AAG5CWW2_ANOAO
MGWFLVKGESSPLAASANSPNQLPKSTSVVFLVRCLCLAQSRRIIDGSLAVSSFISVTLHWYSFNPEMRMVAHKFFTAVPYATSVSSFSILGGGIPRTFSTSASTMRSGLPNRVRRVSIASLSPSGSNNRCSTASRAGPRNARCSRRRFSSSL